MNNLPDFEKHNLDLNFINNLISEINLNQLQIAKALGVTARAVRHWAKGTRSMPYIAQYALENLPKKTQTKAIQNLNR
tara:strand:+ start:278 stop:511 length:234 start_codon:yes stop_codon:yes gene_type:complete